MNIWSNKNAIENYYVSNPNIRKGLILRVQKGVDAEVRRSCIEFAKWLRMHYYFPIRVPVYIKKAQYVKTQSQETVSAKFFAPYDKLVEPYISIATGDIKEIEQKQGKDEALAAVLCSLAHELTHYFQWINDVDLASEKAERQARYYKKKIVWEYSKTHEHP